MTNEDNFLNNLIVELPRKIKVEAEHYFKLELISIGEILYNKKDSEYLVVLRINDNGEKKSEIVIFSPKDINQWGSAVISDNRHNVINFRGYTEGLVYSAEMANLGRSMLLNVFKVKMPEKIAG